MKNSLKLEEIRPKKVMVGQKVAMGKDIKKLTSKKYNFESVFCPACNKNNYKYLYEKNYTHHVLCLECKTQFVTPRLTEKSLKDFYIESDNYEYWSDKVYLSSFEARKNKIFVPRLNKLLELLKNKGLNRSFIEVGAAHGIFCKIVDESNHFDKVLGIEPTPGLAELARSFGVNIIEETYEKTNLKEKVSVIASFEVIEHLHSPIKFLSWCHENLQPGGCLYISCPNIEGFETNILGKFSGTVDHQHINLFNTKSVELLMKRAGFTGVKVETPGELDVEIVSEALENNLIKFDSIQPEYQDFFKNDKLEKLQEILKKSNMSSHMIASAYKPNESA